jgi:hypothetical protein
MNIIFLVLGFLHGVRSELTSNVSETVVGSIFTIGTLLLCSFAFLLMTSEDGTHSGFRNVVSKFTSQTVQKPQNQKSNISLAHLVENMEKNFWYIDFK